MKTTETKVQFIYSPSSNRIYNETGRKEDVREPICEFWSKSTAEAYAAFITTACNNFYPMLDELQITERYLIFLRESLNWLDNNHNNLPPRQTIQGWIDNQLEMLNARIKCNQAVIKAAEQL